LQSNKTLELANDGYVLRIWDTYLRIRLNTWMPFCIVQGASILFCCVRPEHRLRDDFV